METFENRVVTREDSSDSSSSGEEEDDLFSYSSSDGGSEWTMPEDRPPRPPCPLIFRSDSEVERLLLRIKGSKFNEHGDYSPVFSCPKRDYDLDLDSQLVDVDDVDEVNSISLASHHSLCRNENLLEKVELYSGTDVPSQVERDVDGSGAESLQSFSSDDETEVLSDVEPDVDSDDTKSLESLSSGEESLSDDEEGKKEAEHAQRVQESIGKFGNHALLQYHLAKLQPANQEAADNAIDAEPAQSGQKRKRGRARLSEASSSQLEVTRRRRRKKLIPTNESDERDAYILQTVDRWGKNKRNVRTRWYSLAQRLDMSSASVRQRWTELTGKKLDIPSRISRKDTDTVEKRDAYLLRKVECWSKDKHYTNWTNLAKMLRWDVQTTESYVEALVAKLRPDLVAFLHTQCIAYKKAQSLSFSSDTPSTAVPQTANTSISTIEMVDDSRLQEDVVVQHSDQYSSSSQSISTNASVAPATTRDVIDLTATADVDTPVEQSRFFYPQPYSMPSTGNLNIDLAAYIIECVHDQEWLLVQPNGLSSLWRQLGVELGVREGILRQIWLEKLKPVYMKNYGIPSIEAYPQPVVFKPLALSNRDSERLCSQVYGWGGRGRGLWEGLGKVLGYSAVQVMCHWAFLTPLEVQYRWVEAAYTRAMERMVTMYSARIPVATANFGSSQVYRHTTSNSSPSSYTLIRTSGSRNTEALIGTTSSSSMGRISAHSTSSIEHVTDTDRHIRSGFSTSALREISKQIYAYYTHHSTISEGQLWRSIAKSIGCTYDRRLIADRWAQLCVEHPDSDLYVPVVPAEKVRSFTREMDVQLVDFVHSMRNKWGNTHWSIVAHGLSAHPDVLRARWYCFIRPQRYKLYRYFHRENSAFQVRASLNAMIDTVVVCNTNHNRDTFCAVKDATRAVLLDMVNTVSITNNLSNSTLRTIRLNSTHAANNKAVPTTISISHTARLSDTEIAAIINAVTTWNAGYSTATSVTSLWTLIAQQLHNKWQARELSDWWRKVCHFNPGSQIVVWPIVNPLATSVGDSALIKLVSTQLPHLEQMSTKMPELKKRWLQCFSARPFKAYTVLKSQRRGVISQLPSTTIVRHCMSDILSAVEITESMDTHLAPPNSITNLAKHKLQSKVARCEVELVLRGMVCAIVHEALPTTIPFLPMYSTQSSGLLLQLNNHVLTEVVGDYSPTMNTSSPLSALPQRHLPYQLPPLPSMALSRPAPMSFGTLLQSPTPIHNYINDTTLLSQTHVPHMPEPRTLQHCNNAPILLSERKNGKFASPTHLPDPTPLRVRAGMSRGSSEYTSEDIKYISAQIHTFNNDKHRYTSDEKLWEFIAINLGVDMEHVRGWWCHMCAMFMHSHVFILPKKDYFNMASTNEGVIRGNYISSEMWRPETRYLHTPSPFISTTPTQSDKAATGCRYTPEEDRIVIKAVLKARLMDEQVQWTATGRAINRSGSSCKQRWLGALLDTHRKSTEVFLLVECMVAAVVAVPSKPPASQERNSLDNSDEDNVLSIYQQLCAETLRLFESEQLLK